MSRALYVYPNVSGIPQRGGLSDRWKLAKELDCNYIEVPADFIKNKTEVKKTGLNLGELLTEKAVLDLYKKDSLVDPSLRYILHTEPSLSRNDGYGISNQAPLRWYDDKWVSEFINMLLVLARFLGSSPAIIEIHPGDKRNSFENLLCAAACIKNRFKDEFRIEPGVFIENRTGQFISSGRDILGFWEFLCKNHHDLLKGVGVILDVQQLYTVTKEDFLQEFGLIPLESIKGVHIHYRHRCPDLSNEIPWNVVFAKLQSLKDDLIINTEIHHKNKVKDAIGFCEMMFNSV